MRNTLFFFISGTDRQLAVKRVLSMTNLCDELLLFRGFFFARAPASTGVSASGIPSCFRPSLLSAVSRVSSFFLSFGRGYQKIFIRQHTLKFSLDEFLNGREIKRPFLAGKAHRLAVRHLPFPSGRYGGRNLPAHRVRYS